MWRYLLEHFSLCKELPRHPLLEDWDVWSGNTMFTARNRQQQLWFGRNPKKYRHLRTLNLSFARVHGPKYGTHKINKEQNNNRIWRWFDYSKVSDSKKIFGLVVWQKPPGCTPQRRRWGRSQGSERWSRPFIWLYFITSACMLECDNVNMFFVVSSDGAIVSLGLLKPSPSYVFFFEGLPAIAKVWRPFTWRFPMFMATWTWEIVSFRVSHASQYCVDLARGIWHRHCHSKHVLKESNVHIKRWTGP